MISLYVNTTDIIQIGILDSSYSWIAYKDTKESRASDVLHSMLFELLEENNYSLKDVKNVFNIAGPGSYTGLRLGEGFAQTLTLAKIKHYSFYLTDLFSFLNLENSLFYSNAFKSETYIFNTQTKKSQLVKGFSLDEYKNFTLYSLDGQNQTRRIFDLIAENPTKIFPIVEQKNMNKEIFYYRSLDEEFSK